MLRKLDEAIQPRYSIAMKRIFSRENLLALGLCILIILLILLTAESGPTFIYQRF